MRLAAASIAALLAGCALTPAEVIEQGPRSDHALALPPPQAAACIARNVETRNDAWRAEVRPAMRPNGFDVVLRIAGDTITFGTVGIVEVSPAGAAARATVYRHPSATGGAMFDDLTKGC